MSLKRDTAERVIDTYIDAWVNQDPELILDVFTESGVYHERVLEESSICGHEGIKRYWQEKVVNSQAFHKVKLLSLYVDGDTAIAEWAAQFKDLERGVWKRMREVAILEFEGDRIAHLREYWSSDSAEQLSDWTSWSDFVAPPSTVDRGTRKHGEGVD